MNGWMATLRHNTQRLEQRYRVIRWAPMALPQRTPLADRIAARQPAVAEPPKGPAWMARMKAKELVR